MRLEAALRAAVARLRAGGVEEAASDARRLVAHGAGLHPERLTLHLPDLLTAAQTAAIETAVSARLARQPVAQIVGRRAFWGRDFAVTHDTLDPRPDTETLVAEALRERFTRVLDLGTGTGCILLTLLAETAATGLGTDLSERALEVARRNAASLGLSGRAELRLSDWFAQVPERFDLIVSNPPYIAADEMAALAPEVRDWEPWLALTPGGDGLDAYRSLARGAPDRLLPGGRLLLEIGPTQAGEVSALLSAGGLAGIRVLQDLDGRDRVVAARAPG